MTAWGLTPGARITANDYKSGSISSEDEVQITSSVLREIYHIAISNIEAIGILYFKLSSESTFIPIYPETEKVFSGIKVFSFYIKGDGGNEVDYEIEMLGELND